MRHVLSGSDFELAQLKTDPGGLTLYLSLPQDFTDTHYRWLRMIVQLITSEMQRLDSDPATGHRILMVLDEFAGLKRMTASKTRRRKSPGRAYKARHQVSHQFLISCWRGSVQFAPPEVHGAGWMDRFLVLSRLPRSTARASERRMNATGHRSELWFSPREDVPGRKTSTVAAVGVCNWK